MIYIYMYIIQYIMYIIYSIQHIMHIIIWICWYTPLTGRIRLTSLNSWPLMNKICWIARLGHYLWET